eukprot:CAMPEP_0176344044 /NCGR_PEP_ID=MMETSP0126-20121128/4400_1 /TAXON_ID=141414 ORGANISM="Strombidinopsis acuminatum, Strain SPMC142" /NCGR_SAMPLE_ID=MMETSP0126 /ASSEMBLY_ACC=CAM_ASM_000229 /LENGTH=90 /DNA_ID=CAMNT_0017690299 /DNA_START=5666 /DNA_END=5938 /DNA_ORIENTATION=-
MAAVLKKKVEYNITNTLTAEDNQNSPDKKALRESSDSFHKRGYSQNSNRQVIMSAAEDIINTTPRRNLHNQGDNDDYRTSFNATSRMDDQ